MKAFPLSLSVQQFYTALKIHIPGIKGIPDSGDVSHSLGEALASAGTENPLYSLLAALRFTLNLQNGENVSVREYLQSAEKRPLLSLLPAELPFACSWQQIPDMHGAIAFYRVEEESLSADFYIASEEGIFSISGLAEDWKKSCFTDGESLQDYIVDKNLFQGDYVKNFKAGILGAQMFSRIADQLPMDRKA